MDPQAFSVDEQPSARRGGRTMTSRLRDTGSSGNRLPGFHLSLDRDSHGSCPRRAEEYSLCRLTLDDRLRSTHFRSERGTSRPSVTTNSTVHRACVRRRCRRIHRCHRVRRCRCFTNRHLGPCEQATALLEETSHRQPLRIRCLPSRWQSRMGRLSEPARIACKRKRLSSSAHVRACEWASRFSWPERCSAA